MNAKVQPKVLTAIAKHPSKKYRASIIWRAVLGPIFAVLSLLLLTCEAAQAEWLPPFDLFTCAAGADTIVRGTLDTEGHLQVKEYCKTWASIPFGTPLPTLQVKLDEYHRRFVQRLAGNNPTCEVFAFLGKRQSDGEWPLAFLYRSLVGIKGDHLCDPQNDPLVLRVAEMDGEKLETAQYFSALLPTAVSSTMYRFQRWRSGYDFALIQAISHADYDLANDMLKYQRGADANTRIPDCLDSEMHASECLRVTPLEAAVSRCSAKPDLDRRCPDFVARLLTLGADPNIADRYGVTSLMVAERRNSPEAAAMLRTMGARPYDLTDPKVKAALIRVDAALLEDVVDDNYAAYSSLQSFYQEYPSLKHPPKPGKISPDVAGKHLDKVMENSGVDLLGNPYIISRAHTVTINPKTMAELAPAVGPEFWEGFLPLRE